VAVSKHRVAVVVDPNFGERIVEMTRECHAWVVRSPVNDAALARLRREDQDQTSSAGATDFEGSGSAEDSFLAVLPTVDEHHGFYSHGPTVSILHVIGTQPSEHVRDELAALGFSEIVKDATGFSAHRSTSGG
jgi:hypothetical protein